jgi:SAM-dependent methyltransferase
VELHVSSGQVDWKIWQDPAVARGFADRRASVPGTELQLDVMRRLIGRVPQVHRVLDVGCGDGFLLWHVKRNWPAATSVALDGSDAMLERARKRFEEDPTVKFNHADFNSSRWVTKLPFRGFDAVISGFAIHHSEDDTKRRIYRDIFELLSPGGVFVNIEHVASATPVGEEIWEQSWAEYDVAYRRSQGEQVDFQTALQQHRTSEQKAANRLSPVPDQLDWLRTIGFVDVDCYFKYLELAVLAGYRAA